jgi:hypothetical protein
VGGVASSDLRVGVRDIGDGTYEVRWHGEVKGMYRLSVRLASVHVAGSPVPLRMLSARPEPQACVMGGDGLREAQAGREALIVVRCKDRFGNAIDADKRTRMWIELRRPRGDGRTSDRGARAAGAGGGGDGAADTEPWDPGEKRGLQTCEALWADDGMMELRYLTTRAGIFDVVLWCEHESESFELVRGATAKPAAAHPACPPKHSHKNTPTDRPCTPTQARPPCD